MGPDSSSHGRKPIVSRVFRTSGSRGLIVLDETVMNRQFPNERFESRSDHASFTRRGVPALWFFTGPHEDYHLTTDDAGKLNYGALTRIARLAHDLTVGIANTPERSRRTPTATATP